MSRKRCIRKVWARVNPIEYAMQGAAITPREALDKLLTAEYASLDAFIHGAATMREWSDMVNLNNLTQTLAGMNIGPEAMPDCHKAEEGLIEAARRFQNTGKMGLSGPAIQALRDVVEWHDLQRSSIPRRQYEDAIRLTAARVKSGHNTIDLAKTLAA